MMDDLISKKSLLSDYDKKHKGPAGRARKLIEDAPSIPAVPLDKLCEWLADNALIQSGAMANAWFWKGIVLATGLLKEG